MVYPKPILVYDYRVDEDEPTIHGHGHAVSIAVIEWMMYLKSNAE